MDLISMAWDVMSGFQIAPYLAVVILIILVCGYFLLKEFGKTLLAHVFHRRNLPSVCGILLFFCAFWLLCWRGVFFRFPVGVRVLLISLYGLYIAVVLRSVQVPTLWSGHYLRQYQKWLKRGEACEHNNLIERKPWYILDKNEKLAYQILRAKYLYEQGSFRASYHAYTELDQRLLYTEERSDVTYSMAVLLIELGNLTKAKEVIQPLRTDNPPAFFALQSFLEELQGDLDKSYDSAVQGENSIPQNYKDYNALSALYTHLGRLHYFRNNTTEMFRYYRLALQAVGQYWDLRLYHTVYQNLLAQIQICHMFEDEFDDLMEEYVSSMAGASLKNQMELINFRIATARQTGDQNLEYDTIREGYDRLHAMTRLPDQCMVEISTLGMLANGGYPADFVLHDVKKHFDFYFQLPMPSRINAVQRFVLPQPRSPEEAALFAEWTQKLIAYANEHAMADLDEYERGLSTNHVNERCWVHLQRIDFIRRTQRDYDGEAVLRSMRDIVRIYETSGQVARKAEAEMNLVKEYDELINMGQREPDPETMDNMRQITDAAYADCLRAPAAAVAATLIDIAYFSAKLDNATQAREAFQRFQSSKAPPKQFSLRHQSEYEVLSRFLSVQA